MSFVDLNGQWQLYYRQQQSGKTISLPDFSAIKNVPCNVPGNVELDLLRAGIINDPFAGSNVFDLKKIESYEWWYVREFDVPDIINDSEFKIIFEGLDCICDIWLNDELIGSSCNSLISNEFNITEYLKQTKNKLIVHINSAVMYARNKEITGCEDNVSESFEALFLRKPAHSFGWDIAPRIVSAGIWRDVKVQKIKTDRISSAYFWTRSIGIDKAILSLKWQFKTDENDISDFELKIAGICGESKFTETIKPFSIVGRIDIEIESPTLWWPKGYGRADLYDVTLKLFYKGKLVDCKAQRIGIRKIELEMTETNLPSRAGKFLFRCNDEPIMVKGANHVPFDVFHSRDKDRMNAVLDLFDDLQCNMIRCWGGNVYEDHEFYDYCDQNGIMVWQDFMMACLAYPQTDEFCCEIKKEAEFIIKKLRNHACIALWAGDNEVDMISMDCYGLDPSKNKLTRQVIADAVSSFDPFRAYLPSSPYCGQEVYRCGDITIASEQHLWGPRDYYKSDYYSRNNACFASEIGYHGAPCVESIKEFISPEHLWPWFDDPQWLAHATEPVQGGCGKQHYRFRNQLMFDQIYNLFGLKTANLDDFVKASQISQAEALKYFIEMFRSSKWDKSGILWWNVIDGWPQFSDSVVDYYFRKKLAYNYIKRSQQPVCIMVKEVESEDCELVVANDTLEEATGTYSLVNFDTCSVLAEDSYVVAPNSNKILKRIRLAQELQGILLIKYTVNERQFTNHYLYGKPPFSFDQYSNVWLREIENEQSIQNIYYPE